jgi:hypothetical protein
MSKDISEYILIVISILQRSLILLILYLIYNTDLLSDYAKSAENITISGWVDDVSFITIKTLEQANIRRFNRACSKVNK